DSRRGPSEWRPAAARMELPAHPRPGPGPKPAPAPHPTREAAPAEAKPERRPVRAERPGRRVLPTTARAQIRGAKRAPRAPATPRSELLRREAMPEAIPTS